MCPKRKGKQIIVLEWEIQHPLVRKIYSIDFDPFAIIHSMEISLFRDEYLCREVCLYRFYRREFQLNEYSIARRVMENHLIVFDRIHRRIANVLDEEFSFEINFVSRDIIENGNRRKWIRHDYHWHSLLMIEDFQRRVNRDKYVHYHVHNWWLNEHELDCNLHPYWNSMIDCLSTKISSRVERSFSRKRVGLTAAAEAYKACCNSFGSMGSNIDGRRPRVCRDIRRTREWSVHEATASSWMKLTTTRWCRIIWWYTSTWRWRWWTSGKLGWWRS